ncbi:hypothetical protein HanIR_Chr12g0569551 [Helianthus annuus]|nr:hypothetical protein HanIR_Chr12g0569551 [Helianthus annuus]
MKISFTVELIIINSLRLLCSFMLFRLCSFKFVCLCLLTFVNCSFSFKRTNVKSKRT